MLFILSNFLESFKIQRKPLDIPLVKKGVLSAAVLRKTCQINDALWHVRELLFECSNNYRTKINFCLLFLTGM